MTPAERQLWLARHNAPKNMRLLTELELAVITNGLLGERKARLKLDAQAKQCQDHLDHYYREQPDLVNACHAATFDARRYAICTEQALAALVCAGETLALIAEHGVNTATLMDLATSTVRVKAALQVIVHEREKRLEHIKPADEPSLAEIRGQAPAPGGS
jgi:hypothetical protein